MSDHCFLPAPQAAARERWTGEGGHGVSDFSLSLASLAVGLLLRPSWRSTMLTLRLRPAAHRLRNAGTTATAAKSAPDARALLNSGADALAGGKLDQAHSLALQATAVGQPALGDCRRFAGSAVGPMSIRLGAHIDRTEADKLLVEARNSAWIKATSTRPMELASKADRLHGPYSVWTWATGPTAS